MIDLTQVTNSTNEDDLVTALADRGMTAEIICRPLPEIEIQMTDDAFEIVGTHNIITTKHERWPSVWRFSRQEPNSPGLVLIRTKGLDDHIAWWLN